MLAGVAAVLVNLCFNYVLIFGHFGFEAMGVRGTAYMAHDAEGLQWDTVECPSFDDVCASKPDYARSVKLQYDEQDAVRGKALLQRHGKRVLIQNPPSMPLTTEEMDHVYALPYMRTYHPSYEALGGVPAEVLLTPTRIYVKTVLALIEKVKIMGIAHITGGGFIENIPRILPVGLAAKIDRNSYELPPLFKELQRRADISYEKMCNTFNMGIGMVLAVDRNDEEAAIKELRALGEDPVRLGEVVEGEGVIL